ncbi:MAG TPA: glutathione S-transferase family protein [Caulobacteraceae bacterium]
MGIKPDSGQFVVIGQKGTGSVAIEATLTLLGAPYRLEEVRHAQFHEHNPMVQVPVLVTPQGERITESAAILLWLAEAHPQARLAPAPGDPGRAQFLRWMAFVASAIYALYWVRDDPSRVVADKAAQAEVKAALGARIADNWGVMEAGLTPQTYLLGDEISGLDVYVTVVSRWTARKRLHETIAPRIGEVVRRVEADPRLAELFADRFPLRTDA